MSIQANAPARAGFVAFTPVFLLAALSSHPYLSGRLPNDDAVAAEVAADPTRWGIVHLAAAVASALLAVAFLAIRRHLREAGEDRWSSFALPFVVVGSTLYAVLPGMEFAPLAAHESGGDVAAAQDSLNSWFVAVLIAGTVAFAVGMAGFAVSIWRSGLLGTALTRIVVVALIVMALARMVPLAASQFYVHGVAALVAMLPVAYSIWKQPAVSAAKR